MLSNKADFVQIKNNNFFFRNTLPNKVNIIAFYDFNNKKRSVTTRGLIQ
jgi:transposase